MLTVKLLLDSIVSTPNPKFMSIDIKVFYLNTPMPRYEYMQLKLSNLPDDIIRHYKLANIATTDGHIYTEIRRGMYGIPVAGILVQQLLQKTTQHRRVLTEQTQARIMDSQVALVKLYPFH